MCVATHVSSAAVETKRGREIISPSPLFFRLVALPLINFHLQPVAPASVVTVGGVVVDEGAAKALVAKDRPAELADASGRGQPAGTLEVEVADALQEKVVLLIQEVGAEFFGGRHHVPGCRLHPA